MENNTKNLLGTDILKTVAPAPLVVLSIGLMSFLFIASTLNGTITLKKTLLNITVEKNMAAVATANKKDKASNEDLITNTKPQETNQIIVKFKDKNIPPGLSIAAEKANLEKAQGLKHVFTIKGIDAQVYQVGEDDTSSEVVDRILAKHKDVIEYAEVDVKVPLTLTPNDPYFANAWHLPKIQAPTAWDSTAGEGVTVAILDTGVDPDNPDLVGNLVPGWNFYDNNDNTSDVYGHGTKVAGVATAVLNNGLGVSSPAGKSKLMPIRVASPDGMANSSVIANGIVFAADNGAKVANVSYANQPMRSATINAAQYMKNKGGLVVVSAGNNGIDEGFAPTSSMIPVSATISSDTKASWSSYGNYVMMSAPGAGIYTTINGGSYGAVSGTSASAPVVAGVISLIFSANPQLTSAEAESILFSSADDLGAAGWDPLYGHGRVNAAKAVATALATKGTQDTEPPTTPTNLKTSNITDKSVSLSWSASTDNVLVSGYSIYRNGQKITTVSNLNYTDSNLSPNTNYTYTVSAIDKSGNESTQSPAVSITTADTAFAIASQQVTNKTVSSATVEVALTKNGSVTIKYGLSSDNLNQTAQSATSSTNHSINLTNLTANTTYYYQIVATDTNNQTVTSAVSSFKTARSGGKKR